MKFPCLTILSATLLIAGACAAEPLVLPVWPDGKMPGTGATAPIDPKTGQPSRNAVTHPEIAIHPASKDAQPAPAILICPGGGYNHLAFDKEGTEIAAWLNTIGITGITLKYRVPDNREGAFQDIQRAMRLVRSHARDWHIDPAHIGVMGFSAGGHLSARLCNNYEKPAYPPLDAIDSASCKPDFAILVYPAYLDAQGKVAPELPVSAATTPPTLIIHNEDDPGYLRGSRIYHAALDAARVPNEFIVFKSGGHGYGLRSKEDVGAWPLRAKEWLAKTGVPVKP